MKALILAAGYATRLYPLTENQPKPLLQVAGKPIIEHILAKIKALPEVNEVIIVTNHRFYDAFRTWLNHYSFPKKTTLLDDGTINNDDRLGAVGDINFVLNELDFDDDLMVIAGDNLFGFSLPQFHGFYQKLKKTVVAFHNIGDLERVRKRYGVGVLEGTKVIHFEEKPAKPSSSLVSTACYIFAKEDLKQIQLSIEQGHADNPGDLIRWLVQHSEVQGFVFNEHWFDVGSFDSLQEAEQLYSSRK